MSVEELAATTKRVRGRFIKKILIAAGLKTDACEECGQGPTWNGKPLVIQPNHEDGDPTNNRTENIKFMCPKCHTQTPTFSGRNTRRSDAGSD